MTEYNTDSNNSNPGKPQRFGENLPDDAERQAELAEQSVQRHLRTQRYLEQEAKEYLNRSVYQDYAGVDHGEE